MFKNVIYIFACYSWNDAYALELDNFKNFGDHGAEWFGGNVGKKMIEYDIFNYINIYATFHQDITRRLLNGASYEIINFFF